MIDVTNVIKSVKAKEPLTSSDHGIVTRGYKGEDKFGATALCTFSILADNDVVISITTESNGIVSLKLSKKDAIEFADKLFNGIYDHETKLEDEYWADNSWMDDNEPF